LEGAIDETHRQTLSHFMVSLKTVSANPPPYSQSNITPYSNGLRAYYIVGDDMKSNSIFSKIAHMEAEGKTSFPFSSGKNKYDFIDINVLADQIAAASVQDKVTGRNQLLYRQSGILGR
jgi:hypothetical protein